MTQRKFTADTIERVALIRRKGMKVAVPTPGDEAPSLIPEPHHKRGREFRPPSRKEKEVIPDVREAVENEEDRVNVALMMEEHARLGDQIRPLEKEKEKLTDALKGMAGKYALTKLQAGEYRMNYYNSPVSFVDPLKLLQEGVTQDVIDRATVTRDKYTMRIDRTDKEKGKGAK